MPEKKNESVILLHGILRGKLDMYPITKYLEDKGYDTLNILYPSRKQSLEELTEFVHEKVQSSDHCLENKTLHFVTHSMGSLIARYYIATYKPEKIGRVVMLGPPNTGSEFVDWLSDIKVIGPIFKQIYGPSGQQMRTNYEHIDKDINYPLGVIAGNMSINPLAPWVLPGEHDGAVPVERTKIVGMTDHIVMPTTHSLMMFNPKVMEQIHHFLENDSFKHPDQG